MKRKKLFIAVGALFAIDRLLKQAYKEGCLQGYSDGLGDGMKTGRLIERMFVRGTE